ncbi:hypothetical protein HK102_006881 [Quaeritorhiza haematococci]|nr:hypothetical protein HK102_006881 [Quaeritorhiza haematococci]
MGHITHLPGDLLENIFSIHPTATLDLSANLFVDDRQSFPDPIGSFQRHLATLAVCCRRFAHVSRRLLWRELSIVLYEDKERRKRQVDRFLSIVESSSLPTSLIRAPEGRDGGERDGEGEEEEIEFVEKSSLSTATNLNDHAAEAIVSAVKTLSIEVGGDQVHVEWLTGVLPRLFRVIGARLLHLKIDCSELLLYPESMWVPDVLFGAIEALNVEPRTPKALQTLEVLWPPPSFPTPVQVDINRFTKILATKFCQLQQLSLNDVRAVDPTFENGQEPSDQALWVPATLPDWFEATAPTLQFVRIANSGVFFNEAALSVLARLSKNLRELELLDILGPLTTDSLGRLLTINECLHSLEICTPLLNRKNAARLRAIWPRKVKKYDILAALARYGGFLRELHLCHLDALGSCWEEATTVTPWSPRTMQPFDASISWMNLVSLTLRDLPCFPGRILELVAMAINAKPNYRFPLEELYIGPCPRVGSDELKALLRVSHELRYLQLFDILPNASDMDLMSAYTSSTSLTPVRKILVDNSVLDVIAEFCPHLQKVLFNNCTQVSQKASVMNMIRSCRKLKDLIFQGTGDPLLYESMEGEQPDIVMRKLRTSDWFLIKATGAGLENIRNKIA